MSSATNIVSEANPPRWTHSSVLARMRSLKGCDAIAAEEPLGVETDLGHGRPQHGVLTDVAIRAGADRPHAAGTCAKVGQTARYHRSTRTTVPSPSGSRSSRPFSFTNVCAVLDIESSYLRRVLLALPHRPTGRDKHIRHTRVQSTVPHT